MSTYPVRGRFPDFEHVFIDLLTPIAYTVQTIPDGLDEDALPLIQVRRTGGKVDGEGVADTAFVQIMGLSNTRADSQRIVDDAREAILAAGGTRVNGVLIDWTEEMSGLLEQLDIDPLRRGVEAMFAVSARRVR